MIASFSLICLILTIQGKSVHAFLDASPTTFHTSSIHIQFKPQIGIRSKSGYLSLKSELSSDQFIVKIEKKQTLAINALQALLERQRGEVKETETLIQELSLDRVDQNTFTRDGRATNASDIAVSIYSGFDYGFVSRSEGCRSDLEGGFDSSLANADGETYAPPANLMSLGFQQFMRNFNAIMGEYKEEEDVSLTSTQNSLHQQLKYLTLDTDAIWEKERSRGPIIAPWIIKIPYFVLCYFLDVVFEEHYVFSRFFLLETVARMPYFSYITMLHFYETLGFWRRSSDIKRIHFAEEWNEFHHLLIMESLGGDQSWWVRFMAQHSAILYFTGLTILWAMSPTLAYRFSELLETHAVDTYGQLIDENEELLKKLPPSIAAIEYYTLGMSDPLFGEYQSSASQNGEVRKPGSKMRSLYDVFCAIKCDEADHVSTMQACLDPKVSVLSPSLEKKVLTGLALGATMGYFLSTGDIINIDDLSNVADFADSTEFAELIDEEVTDTSFINTVVDGIIGGLASLANIAVDESQELEVTEIGVYESFLIQLKQILPAILELLSRARL